MRIQVIRHASSATEKEGIMFSPLSAPRAIDDFDVNIVDLSVSNMWTYNASDSIGKIDAYRDLDTIEQMVSNKKNATVVYVLPQNVHYKYDMRYSRTGGNEVQPLKDILDGLQKNSINRAIPTNTSMPKIAYEKTETSVLGHKFDADFYFINPRNFVTKSEKSEKPTTIEIFPKVYATTLAITKTNDDLKCFISALFEKHERTEIPPWMEEIYFGDDIEQRANIEVCKKQIEEANGRILAAQARLKENNEIKSILYTNGDELVSVVFKILEKLLNCDLSEFIDEKKEDFLIKLPRCTFIGEIKGVTSNVKYEHISQLELHYRGYLDFLAETGTTETVKQILIMNPFRTKALNQRDPVHTAQIELAIRNGCLIIETHTLLRIYERFCANQLTVQQCEDVFSNRTGLISLSDFNEHVEDLEPYMV